MTIFVFDTTHHALWAEQVALATGCGAAIEPAPPDARAKCSLALACEDADQETITRALDDAGVPYRQHVAAA